MNPFRPACLLLASLALLLLAFTPNPANAQNAAPPPASPATQPADAAPARRQVFAHYMVCFFSSVEFYKQEIELAQRHGIDGFALNVGAWASKDKATGQWKPDNYTLACERIYEAAKQLGTGFKLFLSADVNTLGDVNKCEDMVRRFHDHPNQFRHVGKPVLSAWAGNPQIFAGVLGRLRDDGLPVCFVPFFYSPRWSMTWSFETVFRFFENQPLMDGIFNFGSDGSLEDVIRSNANGRRVTQMLGKIYMAGLTPTYNSANLRDWRGMQGYGAAWRGLIDDGADWVEITTWSDYQEDSNLMPFRWPAGGERQYFVRDESYLDVTGYYSAWFKTGTPPAITQDKLYLTYRNRGKWNRQAWDEKESRWVDVTATPWPFDQMHDDVGDGVYVDSFLTAPATLRIAIDGEAGEPIALPAGIGHAERAIRPGLPSVALYRAGSGDKPILELVGRKAIVGEPTREDSVRGKHLANRTYTQAGVIGKAIRLDASAGELLSGATRQTADGRTFICNAPQEGSGVRFAVKGLETATYNVRITYQNDSGREARLTLMADGPARAAKEWPYYIPVFLAPTHSQPGGRATQSFFWSLYDNTTFLTLAWKAGDNFGKHDPSDDDRGTPRIESIELIRVEPVKAAAPLGPEPEMASIPAGAFAMGAARAGAPELGEPDESPRHDVAVSAFEMSKFEVTNEEYERFDPGHRRHRDGFSWRDREPVIYVSWVDAVKYCNWLSAQTGKAPVYREVVTDEKTKTKAWMADFSANGYRLPTEAEWEFVAGGRGEGRRYPWGDAPPEGGVHGRFEGAAALRMDVRLASNEEAGTRVVGSFPRGASRDGVLDLAGNVAEWCTDWYAPYTSEKAVDPCVQQPASPALHRVVRGGSWGWYNHSQRVTDREFQNPGYPGYAYIGFRVVRRVGGGGK